MAFGAMGADNRADDDQIRSPVVGNTMRRQRTCWSGAFYNEAIRALTLIAAPQDVERFHAYYLINPYRC